MEIDKYKQQSQEDHLTTYENRLEVEGNRVKQNTDNNDRQMRKQQEFSPHHETELNRT